MLFLFDKQKKALTQQIQELQAKIDQMVKDREPSAQLALNVLYDDIDNSKHVFDWEAVGAFSIERNMRHEQGELVAYTIIGFTRGISENGSIDTGEWSFICSNEEHNRLAKEFEEYLFSKRIKDFKPATKAKK
jgi:hypothetical protein